MAEFWLQVPAWIFVILFILVFLPGIYLYIRNRRPGGSDMSGNSIYLKALARYSQTADMVIDHKQRVRFANEHFLHRFQLDEKKLDNISVKNVPLPLDIKAFIASAGREEDYMDSESGMKVFIQPLNTRGGKYLGTLIRCDMNREQVPGIGKITDLAHEINTPMNSISGYSELLYNEGMLPPEQLQYLQIIREQSENLKNIFNQFFIHQGGSGISPTEHRTESQRIEHILIVDDVSINRTLLRVILTRKGYKVAEASNGYEAVVYFEEHCPDLILMDIRMPVMGGIEAVKKIRNSVNEHKNIPIIAVTASSVFSDQNSLRKHHFDGLLRKPFREKNLLELIGQFNLEEKPQAL